MIFTGTLEASRANRNHRFLANGAGFWRSELIIHVQDEFQLVIDGDGALGRPAVRPISVHFAGRHTGYGPLTAGERGLSYMTLRAVLDLGAISCPSRATGWKKCPSAISSASGSKYRTPLRYAAQPDGSER